MSILHRSRCDARLVETADQKVSVDVIACPHELDPFSAASAAGSQPGWWRGKQDACGCDSYSFPKMERAMTTRWIWFVPS